MFKDKEYIDDQKAYCKMLTASPDFNKYIISYLEWKRLEMFKGFRGISPSMGDSEAKATIMKYEGAIAAIEDIIRRFKV